MSAIPKRKADLILGMGSDFKVLGWNFLGKTDSIYLQILGILLSIDCQFVYI
jgi:hypothetical protein